jgi:hypothetical protein
VTPRFSERIGAVKVEIQIDSMNAALRASIWNLVVKLLPNAGESGEAYHNAVDAITENVLRLPIENVIHSSPRNWLLRHVEQLEWPRVYDLLEFAVGRANRWSSWTLSTEQAINAANSVLEREHSGFRFVAGELAPITSPAEIAEIENAAARAAGSGLKGVQEHIAQALSLLGKRPHPDYRNAAKEAISAVESAARLISRKQKATLDDALTALGKSTPIHPAMIEAFKKLYGYTSDEKGIRHALLDETARVEPEDARFMIVACSAFVNLLIAKADKAGLLKPR